MRAVVLNSDYCRLNGGIACPRQRERTVCLCRTQCNKTKNIPSSRKSNNNKIKMASTNSNEAGKRAAPAVIEESPHTKKPRIEGPPPDDHDELKWRGNPEDTLSDWTVEIVTKVAEESEAGDNGLRKYPADFAQAPAQRGARVIGFVPEQLAQSRASARLVAEQQVGQQSPGLARRRHAGFIAVATNFHFPTQANVEHVGHLTGLAWPDCVFTAGFKRPPEHPLKRLFKR